MAQRLTTRCAILQQQCVVLTSRFRGIARKTKLARHDVCVRYRAIKEASLCQSPLQLLIVNKRFALIGLTDREGVAINDLLADVRANSVRIAADVTLAGINALAPYDACIVDATAITHDETAGGISLADLQRRQVLAIVDESQLGASDLATMHPQWEVIVRPVRRDELLMRLSRLIVRGEQKSLPRPYDGTRKVLVVDDDRTVRALLSGILEAAGFRCDSTPNASEALAALALGRHDLVMLDLGMPEMDGFKVLKAIRSGHPARNPAVIIVTAATREEDIVRGFGLGADDYVIKPFNPRELIARCQRAIRHRDVTASGMRDSDHQTQRVAAQN